MFRRSLQLPAPGEDTFFLWGPRQTGKTTLLRAAYPNAFWVDLLKADEYRRYLQNPERLREELAHASPAQVVVDEVQKVPALLDEIHWLHERRNLRFALCGSSARKVRRGGANLLGGRALRFELHGLTASELGRDFDLDRLLDRGYLPRVFGSARPRQLLESYVADYLKEEIAAEGLVRKLPTFSTFLESAALSDTERVNCATIARDCGGVSPQTVKSYFDVLNDTLLGRWLPAYVKRPKRRVIGAPKFYFADVGVVNHLARRGTIQRRSELYGKAFENWVFHELSAHNAYSGALATLSYWRLASGAEVDFIVNDLDVAIEAKGTANVTADHLRALREIVRDHPRVRRRIVVCLEARRRHTDDGIEIVPAPEFGRRLAAGDIF